MTDDEFWKQYREHLKNLLSNLKNGYGTLRHNKEKRRLTWILPVMKGSKYPNPERPRKMPRIMFVGRAANGWGEEGIDDKLVKGAEYDEILDEAKEDWQFGFKRFNPNGENHSAFWGIQKKVVKRILGESVADNEWYHYLVWSNLYKISFQDGNPTESLAKMIRPKCAELLNLEIEHYKPDHIVAMVGSNWVEDDFKKIFGMNDGSYRPKGVIEFECEKDGIKYIVTKRPECTACDKFVDELAESDMGPLSLKWQVALATDIVDLIGGYLTLKQKGREYIGLCPFHDDCKPSMYVNREKQIFKCFSCGAGGDIFQFVMMKEKVEFHQAVRILADRAGIPTSPENIKP